MDGSRQQSVERRVRFRLFESHTKPWKMMCDEATAFASQILPDDLISISHSRRNERRDFCLVLVELSRNPTAHRPKHGDRIRLR